eukprot:jgi/Hompol1/81/HPOL_005215-RA
MHNIVALVAVCSLATVRAIDHPAVLLARSLPPWPASDLSLDHAALQKHVVETAAWRQSDPELGTHSPGWTLASHHAVGNARVLRIRPAVHGLPVIGADRVLALDAESLAWSHLAVHGGSLASDHLAYSNQQQDLDPDQPSNQHKVTQNNNDDGWYPDAPGFILSSSQAVRISRRSAAHPARGIHSDVADAVAEPLFLSRKNTLLTPIWRIVDNAHLSRDRFIRYIDARSGQIVATIPLVHHLGIHKGYAYGELSQPTFGQRPPLVTLLNVTSPINPVGNGNNGNHSIAGRDFRSSNTCYAYKCENGAANGDCDETQSICVDPNKAMTADGYIDGTIYMAWKNAPVFASRLNQPAPDANGDRTWGTDIDFAHLDGTETNDALAELQVYHYASTHALFMRNLLQDPTLCLVGTGPNCTQVDPVTNRTATRFDTPMRLLVNLQSVKTWPDPGSPYLDMFAQLDKGLGKNMSYPITFYEHTDYANAYFSGSNYQPLTNGTDQRNCTLGACVSIEDSYFPYIAMGQTSTSDWALNNCIVFHELTHTFVHKFIYDLPWVVWSPDGLMSDPGAINEAWADYFAAIHCQVSDFTKTYNGHPIRNLDNSLTCADVVGEVHADGMVFSGALWEVRKSIPSTPPLTNSSFVLYDRIILKALMMGHSTDTFDSQLRLVLSLLSQDATLNVLVPLATSVFSRRVFNCRRRLQITEASDPTFSLPTAQTTDAGYSTIPAQLEIYPRRSDWRMMINWKQWYDSPILGPMYIGYGATKMMVLVSFDCPIYLTGTNSSLVQPYSSCPGDAVNRTLEWTAAGYNSKTKQGSIVVELGLEPPKVVYVWFAHQVPATMVMYSTLTHSSPNTIPSIHYKNANYSTNQF